MKSSGDTSGLKYGERVFVTIEDVTAGAMFIAGTGNDSYLVELDGTEENVTVPGWTISRES